MQIVMRLAGYDLGRSDLVRRAMSKKKADVMAKEREYFVYGNEEYHVPGCIANGLDEKTANKIFDEMTDFAKYAFNKSHAAAYTIVSYQTAWLKCYYPVEFMAALMTSVMDKSTKVAEYVMVCRQMGIEILPPDINDSERDFSVTDGKIRYALSAIKSIGRTFIDGMVKERDYGGPFKNLKDFCERMYGKDLNKRTIENFIKGGAVDSLGHTRRQQMMVYAQMLDQVAADRKKAMSGQMSLFDFVSDEEKESFMIHYPQVGEYDKEDLLAYEKEVLGIYVSGHPLEEYAQVLEKETTAVSADFIPDDETGDISLKDGQIVTVGGMIETKTLKVTRTNKMMAFLNLEDLYGSVEVVVFPNDYERNKAYLNEEEKILVRGRVSASEDQQAKVICEKITPLRQPARQLWLQFATKQDFLTNEQKIYDIIVNHDGNDEIIIFCKAEKAIKKLPRANNIRINDDVLEAFKAAFGESNVRITQSILKN